MRNTKKSAFPDHSKPYNENFGEVDFEDHQADEQEIRDDKLNKELEETGF